MPSRPEIEAARDEVVRSRAQLSRTITELEGRVESSAQAAKEKIDVVQLVKNNPFAALAAAVGIGALVASTGADRRVATATVAKSREAASAGMRAAKSALPSRGAANGASIGASNGSPSRIGTMFDSLAVKLATTMIDALREPRGVTPVVPEVHQGIGFVEHSAPAHADDGPPATGG